MLDSPQLQRRVIKTLTGIGISLIALTVVANFFFPTSIPEGAYRPYHTKLILTKLRSALEQYFQDHERYPTEKEGLQILVGDIHNDRNAYISDFPTDAWGEPFIYRADGSNPKGHRLYSKGLDHLDHQGQGDNIQ